jgi:cell division protease FtsH
LLNVFFTFFNFLNPFSDFGKASSKIQVIKKVDVRFSDVAGIDDAKKELQEIITFLKQPLKFQKLGANIPKGILLIGPPGNGKTLLAKAVAGEANVPFFSVSGSEFVELFVGIGASRMRDLFTRAQIQAPCIIFIDEIDTFARSRGSNPGSMNDEKEQTLNQLLTEMDGFKQNTRVIVLAATNRIEIIDSALLRPGRFDRQVSVNRPTLNGRIQILNVHAKKKRFEKNISFQTIAQRTTGFSGADLESLLNESAILAARKNKKEISINEINKSIDRVIAGLPGSSLPNLLDRRFIAYSAIGHSLIGSILDSHDSFQKVTIIPRGRLKGLTWFTPEDFKFLPSRSKFLSRLTSLLAGRVTEELIYGNHQITTGPKEDILNLTNIAKNIITQFGMSSVGPVTLSTTKSRQTFTGKSEQQSKSSEKIGSKIDFKIKEVIDSCYMQAVEILKENRLLIDFLTEELIVSESLESEEFLNFLNIYISPLLIKEYKNKKSKYTVMLKLDQIEKKKKELQSF